MKTEMNLTDVFARRDLRVWNELACDGEIYFVAIDIAYAIGEKFKEYEKKYDKYANRLKRTTKKGSMKPRQGTITEINKIILPMVEEIEKDFGKKVSNRVAELIVWED